MHDWKKISALSFLEAPVLLTIFLVGVIHTIRYSNWQRAQPYAPTTIPAISGLLEAEQLTIKSKSGAFNSLLQNTGGFKGYWSRGGQLFVQFQSAGNTIDFEIPVPSMGKYRVMAYLTKSYDYGIVQFFLNGKKLGSALDLMSQTEVQATGPLVLGTGYFKKEGNVLRVMVLGNNPQNQPPHFYFGIDGIVVEKQ